MTGQSKIPQLIWPHKKKVPPRVSRPVTALVGLYLFWRDMRPLKQGLDYFPHDTDAVNDEKIQSLMALHGPAGYCFYFVMLEKVFRSEKGQLTCGKPVEKAGLARLMCLPLKQFEAILETALEVGCFDMTLFTESKTITSNGVRKRLEKVNEVRLKERIRKESIKEKKKEEIEREIENYHGKTLGKPSENSGSGVESHSNKSAKPKLTDDEWLQSLKNNIAYEGIDVEKERGKCMAWFEDKGITVSRRRLLNWLNKAEKPLKKGNSYATERKNSPDAYSDIGREVE